MMKYEERDGVMIQGSSLSVDTRIRREAIDLIDEGIPTDSRRYKLMTNGLSSILNIADTTEIIPGPLNQLDMLVNNRKYSQDGYLSFAQARIFDLLIPAVKAKIGKMACDDTAPSKSQVCMGSFSLIGCKIDMHNSIKHGTNEIDLYAAELLRNDGESMIIGNESKLDQEAKDIMGHLISIIPNFKSSVIVD